MFFSAFQAQLLAAASLLWLMFCGSQALWFAPSLLICSFRANLLATALVLCFPVGIAHFLTCPPCFFLASSVPHLARCCIALLLSFFQYYPSLTARYDFSFVAACWVLGSLPFFRLSVLESHSILFLCPDFFCIYLLGLFLVCLFLISQPCLHTLVFFLFWHCGKQRL